MSSTRQMLAKGKKFIETNVCRIFADAGIPLTYHPEGWLGDGMGIEAWKHVSDDDELDIHITPGINGRDEISIVVSAALGNDNYSLTGPMVSWENDWTDAVVKLSARVSPF